MFFSQIWFENYTNLQHSVYSQIKCGRRSADGRSSWYCTYCTATRTSSLVLYSLVVLPSPGPLCRAFGGFRLSSACYESLELQGHPGINKYEKSWYRSSHWRSKLGTKRNDGIYPCGSWTVLHCRFSSCRKNHMTNFGVSLISITNIRATWTFSHTQNFILARGTGHVRLCQALRQKYIF